jgi:hypothetical protein
MMVVEHLQPHLQKYTKCLILRHKLMNIRLLQSPICNAIDGALACLPIVSMAPFMSASSAYPCKVGVAVFL